MNIVEKGTVIHAREKCRTDLLASLLSFQNNIKNIKSLLLHIFS